jgi:Cohesin domain
LIELSLASDQNELKIGEKRQLALQVKSGAPLGLAVITLRFDPTVLKISSVLAGSLFANAKKPPSLTQSVDEHGMVLLSIAPANGSPITADGVLLNLEVEAVSAGDSGLFFDLSNVHLVAGDGRTLTVQVEPIKLTVK